LCFNAFFVKLPSRRIVPNRKLRKAFLDAMLDHEVRERILVLAEYKYKSAHKISLKKEKRDLQRKGLLEDYLSWLKQEYPNAYRERIKAWKITQ